MKIHMKIKIGILEIDTFSDNFQSSEFEAEILGLE